MPRMIFAAMLALCLSTGGLRVADPAPVAAAAPATAGQQGRSVQLVNTSAAEVARLLNVMFAAAPRASAAGATQAGNVSATADERTNTVILTGPPERMAPAMELLKKLDENGNDPTSTSVFFIYHLTNARANDLAPLLNQNFSGTSVVPTVPVAASRPATPTAATYFIANPDTNSILITTNQEMETTIRSMLALLDRSDHKGAVMPAPKPGVP